MRVSNSFQSLPVRLDAARSRPGTPQSKIEESDKKALILSSDTTRLSSSEAQPSNQQTYQPQSSAGVQGQLQGAFRQPTDQAGLSGALVPSDTNQKNQSRAIDSYNFTSSISTQQAEGVLIGIDTYA